MYYIFNNKSLFLLCIFLLTDAKIDTLYIQQHKKKFKSYLENLQRSMSLPSFLVNNSMRVLGYSTEEIDAVPIAYPFIYKEGYISTLKNLDDPAFIDETNKLLNRLEPLFKENTNKQDRRKKAHELIHIWICEKMNLDIKTTTKQFAKLVENKKINLNAFFHFQLIQFFVKYHLDIN